MSFLFLKKKNIEVLAVADLLFTDVSSDPWDVKYLTEENLDYSIESVAIIDTYLERLKKTTYLEKNLIIFSSRVGAYIGEVLRRNLSGVYHWYDFNAIVDGDENLDEYYDIIYQQEVLYSKKKDDYILPMYEVFKNFINKSSYDTMSNYISEMINLR